MVGDSIFGVEIPVKNQKNRKQNALNLIFMKKIDA